MASFINVINPTPFAVYDADTHFQVDANSIVTFVKRRLGDDIISVELTSKQIWAAFEEATLEYSKFINEHMAESHIHNTLGMPIASGTQGPSGMEGKLPRENFDIFIRKAEAYANEAGVGGSIDHFSGSIALERGKQDYSLVNDLKTVDSVTGNEISVYNQMGLGEYVNGAFLYYDDIPNDPADPNYSLKAKRRQKTKPRIFQVFHFSPQAAYRFFDTTSAINYLNNQFAFESFTPETVFYVLPVFEDVLRAGQLDISNRIRRSNYSYEIQGGNIRIYPRPTQENPGRLFFRLAFPLNPFNPDVPDEKINGASNISNLPYGNIMYSMMNSIARQWIREFTLAICRETLGLIRSKFSSIPIPGGDVQMNGSDLVSSGREDQEKLRTQLKETLEKLTMAKILENQNNQADQLTNLLKKIPIPNGPIITG